MKVLSVEEIKERGYPECFGRCLGGTKCWEACGSYEDTTYIRCLLQAKALVEEAIETELLEMIMYFEGR